LGSAVGECIAIPRSQLQPQLNFKEDPLENKIQLHALDGQSHTTVRDTSTLEGSACPGRIWKNETSFPSANHFSFLSFMIPRGPIPNAYAGLSACARQKWHASLARSHSEPYSSHAMIKQTLFGPCLPKAYLGPRACMLLPPRLCGKK